MALIILVVAAAVALVALGFLAPRLSRRLQGRMDRRAEQAEAKAGSQPQPLRSASEGSVQFSKETADRATATGRQGRERAGDAGREHEGRARHQP